uniref:Uncharacterized protein n=1 Tax=Arundo donax TaxID=35708 RepID=A0A0A9C5V6_ARUDO
MMMNMATTFKNGVMNMVSAASSWCLETKKVHFFRACSVL